MKSRTYCKNHVPSLSFGKLLRGGADLLFTQRINMLKIMSTVGPTQRVSSRKSPFGKNLGLPQVFKCLIKCEGC